MSLNYGYNDTGFWCTPVEWTNSYPIPIINTASNIITYTAVTHRCLTRRESLGLMVVVQSGFVSLLAVFYVLLMFIVRAIHSRQLPHVLRESTNLLIISLFTADILQAFGAIMDLKWVHLGNVHVGGYCNAQGIVKQLGETAVALNTLLISIYTGSVIWLNKRIKSIRYTVLGIAFVWLLVMSLLVAGNVGNRHKRASYQSPLPYWCWISTHPYFAWEIAGEYLWLWIALFISMLIHFPLLVYQRLINPHDDRWSKIAISMFFYPVSYCIIVLPMSIVRLMEFLQTKNGAPGSIPGAYTLAVAAIFNLSGLINVVLLVNTRPASGLFSNTMSHASYRAHTQLEENDKEERSIPLTCINASYP